MREDREFRVLSPTGILGYGFPDASFAAGMKRDPDLIAVDAGSTDPGPYYLGAGRSFTTEVGVKRDLERILAAAIPRSIPVVVGSCGGAGAAVHLEWCRDIAAEVAREQDLHFKIGLVYADIERERVRRALTKGRISALDSVPLLTQQTLDETTAIVAQMGMEPITEALDAGCSVVLCGRAYDPAVFSALPISLGYDAGLAVHMGKILECATIAADPGSGADCCLGVLHRDRFTLEPLNPSRPFTRRSVAAHTLYEKADPYVLHGPGGHLDLHATTFTEIGDGRVEVGGSVFTPTHPYKIKLEGVRSRGFRTICVAGCRDPIMVSRIDEILAAARESIAELAELDETMDRLVFRVYGRNGVMGPLEPSPDRAPRELGIVIEAVGPTQEEASSLCATARSVLLHFGYEGRISTAGNLAFPFSPSDVPMGEVFEFSVFHLMEIEDQGIFRRVEEQI